MTGLSGMSAYRRFLAPATLFFLALAFQVWASPVARGADAPRECLVEIGNAMKTADTSAFLNLVDVDGILQQALAEVSAMAKEPEGQRVLPPVVNLMAAQGVFSAGRSQDFLVREAREFILYGVGTGSFAGHPAREYRSSSMLQPLFAMASSGRKEIRGVGLPRQLSDIAWQMPFIVHDDNGSDYPVEGIFTREKGTIRLTGVANLSGLIRQIVRETE